MVALIDEQHEPVDTLTRWRYWLITPELLRPEKARLLPGDPKDRAVWGRGETIAVCRRDPTHRPPHHGCTCGIYAIGGVDVQFGAAGRAWVWDQSFGRVWAEVHGGRLSAPEWPDSPRAQVQFMRRWWRPDSPTKFRHKLRLYSPQNQFVIGRVRLRNAVPNAAPPPTFGGDWQFKSWRGESATIDALYVEDSDAAEAAHCDVGELADALSDKYGVPCEVGYPPYTQADWDDRTTALPGDVPSWGELGLHPPGADAPPPKFFTVTV